MGIYTYIEQSLGLQVTPRLEEILKKKQAHTAMTDEDLAYLIDHAARYTTLNYYRHKKKMKINREYDDVAYEVGELLGDILTELDALSMSSLNAEAEYIVTFETNPFGGKNEMPAIKEYVRESLAVVKRYQKTFDDTEAGYTVVGKLLWLQKQYGIDLDLIATNTVDDVWRDVCSLIHAYVKDEHARATCSLAYLEKECATPTA